MSLRKLLLILILFLFTPFIVNAKTCDNTKVSINSIEMSDISDNTIENNEPAIKGMGVKFDLEMKDVGDFIVYEMTIDNDSNSDYVLDKNSIDIDSNYIDYTLETKDTTNIVKANSKSKVILTIRYKNEVPNELLENGSYVDNQIINVDLLDGLVNPKTGQSFVFIIILIFLFGIVSIKVLKDNKRIGTLLLIIGLLAFPFGVYAMCNIDLKIESNVGIVLDDNNPIVYIDSNHLLRKSGDLCFYSDEGLSSIDYLEASPENLQEVVIANNVKWFTYNYYITKDNELYYIDGNNKILLHDNIVKVADYRGSVYAFLNSNNELYIYNGMNLMKSAKNVTFFGTIPSSILNTGKVTGVYYNSNDKLFYYYNGVSVDMSEITQANSFAYKNNKGEIHGWSNPSTVVENGRLIGYNNILYIDGNNRLYIVSNGYGLYDTNIIASYINTFENTNKSNIYVLDESNSLYSLYIDSLSYSRFNKLSDNVIELGSYIAYDRDSYNPSHDETGTYLKTSGGVVISLNYLQPIYSDVVIKTPYDLSSTNKINQNAYLGSFDYNACLSYSNTKSGFNNISDFRKNEEINNYYSGLSFIEQDGKQYVIIPPSFYEK